MEGRDNLQLAENWKFWKRRGLSPKEKRGKEIKVNMQEVYKVSCMSLIEADRISF